MDTVLNCLVTDSVGPGEYAEKFLKNARETFGFEAAVALRSPYLALLLALRKLGLPPGAKVGLSPLAPLYHLNAVEDSDYSPIFIDHDLHTCAPELATLGQSGCSAFILFDVFGMLPDKKELEKTALPVIEDMTQALGAYRGGTRAGSFGSFTVYGLENSSLVTTGGGALLFASSRRDAPVIRNIAETTPAELLLTDYNAALGLAQLKELDSALQKRKELEEAFRIELARTRHKTFKQEDEGECGHYAFPIALESGMKDVIIHAKRNGIESAPAFEQSIIAAENFPGDECPGAHALAARSILFPLHQKIGGKDAQIIGKVIATLP